MRHFAFIILICLFNTLYATDYQPKYSTAGFFELPESGRKAYSMNPAWRFHQGDLPQAYNRDFSDKDWEMVSLPHGIEYLPSEASGCVNYQGPVWYRKHFKPEPAWRGKKLFLHFEAIMGKSEIWVNGKKASVHFGGYLPVQIDVTNLLDWDGDNVIAVRADNSDDPSYPPGKQQDMLDFSYFGGIYRDCWMIAHNNVYVTNPNYVDKVAGGGVVVAYDNVSRKSADVHVAADVQNDGSIPFKGKILYEIVNKEGKTVARAAHPFCLEAHGSKNIAKDFRLKNPRLWTPDTPSLYHLNIWIKNSRGEVVDGFYKRIGVRSIEFRGKDGFWLNGEHYKEPLIGANRHQDFAVIGNALSNSLHWRDAKKLRDAGLRVIRNAHYPQDPAFMDACDELGLFVIVNTPGWQFWNEAPSFAQYVYNDIRNMVRRDRDHASVWLWEPILNETWYPEDFAEKVKSIVAEEFPFSSCYSGCDASARGHEGYPVQFTHPSIGGGGVFNTDKLDPNVTYFTREWGDNVDDWNSHNSPSRAYRGWGEVPMLIQARGYANPGYPYTCYDVLYQLTPQHIGGCLWHSFDHQRGYHPDPFYGGIMDAYRQPKLSYYMFMSQRPAEKNEELIAASGPMVYIANAMTPFSPEDVTVYSNCDEVHLTCCKDTEPLIYKKDKNRKGMPSPVITFKNVWDVMHDKALDRANRGDESYLLAEGYVDGKLVATHKVTPSRRPSRLQLTLDNEGVNLHADGSDMVTLVASMTDDKGSVKRLNNAHIKFEIEGPGEIVGDNATFTNPRAVEWGTAPVIIKAGTTPGVIRVRAHLTLEGIHTPKEAEIEIPVYPAEYPLVADRDELKQLSAKRGTERQKTTAKESDCEKRVKELQEQLSKLKLKEVARQQGDFE